MNKRPFLQIVSHYKKDIGEKGIAIKFNRTHHINWCNALFFDVRKVIIRPNHDNGLYSLQGTIYSNGRAVGYVSIFPDELDGVDPAPVADIIARRESEAREQMFKIKVLDN